VTDPARSADDAASVPAVTGDVAPSVVATAEGAIRQVLESGSARSAEPLPPHLRNLPQQGEHQDLQLKKEYARFIKRALTFELAISNAVFIAYAWAGKKWDLDPAVINIWLGATVVQVIGVVLVVTRHLFPLRDNQSDGKA
jgi:hypothetical protein